jgi:hypothetical protein
MHGTNEDPGISQFRRLWAMSMAAAKSAAIRNIERHHSRLFMNMPSLASVTPVWSNCF